jgi:cytochrome c biogenesis protein CcmG, thiol:disulfide interchange protein DsbE
MNGIDNLQRQYNRRRFLRTGLLSAAGLLIVATRRSTGDDSGSGPREGLRAPDFRLSGLEGGETALSDLRGSVTVLNFWASWCGPCRAEMPALDRLYRAEQGNGLAILAVNSTVQDDRTAVAAFVDEYGLSFPILLDLTGSAGRDYGVRALPSTFVIDRKGIVRRVLYGGPLSEAVLRAAVEPLMWENS